MAARIKNRVNGHNSAAIWRSYDKIPFAQLVCAIVKRKDREALRELHENRRVFRSQSGRNVLMAEFLVELKGRRCRAWLQENIPDPDPARPGERDRVQALVDRLLTRRRILSLEQLRETGV